jgi:NitT/TauT family transport system substrate-binding protein
VNAVLSRRSWLAAGAALLAADAVRRPAQAQTLPLLKVAAASTEGQAEAYYAEYLGLFKQHGLNVELHRLTSAITIGPAIASGDLHIGVGNVLALGQAHAHNIPFVIIAPGGIHDWRFPTGALVVPTRSLLTSPKELGGKTVAVATINGLDQLAGDALIDQSGGDLPSVKFVELPPPSIPDALAQGRVDAALLQEPALSAAADRVRSIGNAEDAIARVSVQTAWYALRPWLDANKDAARRFADAIYAAGSWAMANPEKAALVLDKYLGIKEPRAFGRFATKPDLPSIQVVLDVGAKYKLVPPVNAAEFVWDGK